jgi:hypothetical protein
MACCLLPILLVKLKLTSSFRCANMLKLKSKLSCDRWSIGQPALVSGYNLEPMTTFLFYVSQLRVSWCWAPSLTREWVRVLPQHSLSGPSPAELTIIFYCFIWESPNLERQVPVFIFPRNRVAQLYSRALGFLFIASYDSQGYGGSILTRLHSGC